MKSRHLNFFHLISFPKQLNYVLPGNMAPTILVSIRQCCRVGLCSSFIYYLVFPSAVIWPEITKTRGQVVQLKGVVLFSCCRAVYKRWMERERTRCRRFRDGSGCQKSRVSHDVTPCTFLDEGIFQARLSVYSCTSAKDTVACGVHPANKHAA